MISIAAPAAIAMMQECFGNRSGTCHENLEKHDKTVKNVTKPDINEFKCEV